MVQDVIPEGAYRNANPELATLSARGIQVRDAASDIAAAFTQVDFDPSAAIREILGMGETQWDAFTRTELRDDKEINRWARIITLSLSHLENDPKWADCPWVRGPRQMAYLQIKAHLRVSLHRAGKKEGVMVYSRMVVPEWETNNQGKAGKKK